MWSDAASSLQRSWYAVKCLFSHPSRTAGGEFLYEERTTLWLTVSFEEAFTLAESEATKYAESSSCVFVRATDAFQLQEESVGRGSEIWSIMRGSNFEPEVYAETFCATPRDRSSFLD